MPFRIKDRMIARKYRFTELSTNFTITERDIGLLMSKVHKHRAANGIPIGPDLMLEIETQICDLHPAWCEMIDENNQVLPGVFAQMKNLGQSLVRWAAAGMPVVDEATLRQRIDICEHCPHIKRWQEFAVARCGLCGCATGKKINLKLQMATEKCPDKPPRWQ